METQNAGQKDIVATLPFVEGEAPRGSATGGGDASPNRRPRRISRRPGSSSLRRSGSSSSPSAAFILASSMVAPDLFLYKNISWLVFSRVRPVHTNGMIFGFVGSALMGAMYYYVPRLVRAPLYSPRLGRLTVWLWNILVAAGSVTLLLGFSQSREYAEWIWPIDILVLLTLGDRILQPLQDRCRQGRRRSSTSPSGTPSPP